MTKTPKKIRGTMWVYVNTKHPIIYDEWEKRIQLYIRLYRKKKNG